MSAAARPLAPAASASPLVEVEDLGRVFDLSKRWLNRVLDGSGRVLLTAVDGVDIKINRGETYALVGESGSGKSTIAKMVVGLLPPTRGSVRIGGADIWAESGAVRQRQIRRQIQMIFQDPFASLNPRWRVGSIVAEPVKAFGLIPDARDREARVGELLSLVGLDPRDAGKFPHEFSGGQRQRIAIARCLTLQPEVLVLDEAVSALDVSVQAQVLNLLKDLQDEFGLSYIFISHDLAVVKFISDEVLVMQHGDVVEQADARALLAAPKQEYTKRLLGAVPRGYQGTAPTASVA